MKKLICCILAAALTACLVLTVAAAEVTACTVTAESVPAIAGGTVTVPIRISGGTGFTNFGIALDYDRDALTLTAIDVDEDSLLNGAAVSANAGWTGADGETYGYLTCASPEKITGDGLLFTATFQVGDGVTGSVSVTPVVHYVRNNTALFSVFEEIPANAVSAELSVIRMGDVNQDGEVDVIDALMAYRAYRGVLVLSDAQETAADLNQDGEIDVLDALLIYRIYRGV